LSFFEEVSTPLKVRWQQQVLVSCGYRELGMFEDAAQALEEIEPEDKTRNEVLYARVDIYLAAKKWHLAAAVASRLVKADPGNPAAWINLAYAVRRAENIQAAESPAREIQLERNADRDSLEEILRVARLREVSGLIGTQPVVEATDFSQNGRH
jgi:predicted Zn-dependent protease